MNEQNRNNHLLAVCRLCGKEVPRSAAQTAEGRDYTYYSRPRRRHEQQIKEL